MKPAESTSLPDTRHVEFRYRPEVDGLRALAVTLVILFHAGLGWSGGFVGVDVFFVISGFLITGLVRKEQQRGEFSLAKFWARRIRRIIPAVTAVVLATLVAGYFLLLPDDYIELGKSAIAQQLMLANVFFWRSTGYFAGDSDVKPLLHTWSLAVEEQFYLFYPLILIVLRRASHRKMAIAVASLGLVSFALSLWGVHNYPVATFYLLPTRAWELFLGGLICFTPVLRSRSSLLPNTLGFVGIALILVPAWLLTAESLFPGLNALAPCLGAAIFIYSNHSSPTLAGRLLSTKPIVILGLASYSLYLWHWPIMAFCRYWLTTEEFTQYLPWILLAIATLAIASWQLVEKPFRGNKTTHSLKRPIVAWTSSSLALMISGAYITALAGIPSRLDPRVITFTAAARSRSFIYDSTVLEAKNGSLPRFGSAKSPPSILVWGDSHAMALMPGIDYAAIRLGLSGIQATHSSTAPVLNYAAFNSKYSLQHEAPEFGKAVIELVKSHNIKVVILAACWNGYAFDPVFFDCLADTIQTLESLGCQTAIILDVANQKTDVPRQLARQLIFGGEFSGVRFQDHLRESERVNTKLTQLSSENSDILDPSPFFVGADGDYLAFQGSVVFYRDSGHLTTEGGLRLSPLFVEYFKGFTPQIETQK